MLNQVEVFLNLIIFTVRHKQTSGFELIWRGKRKSQIREAGIKIQNRSCRGYSTPVWYMNKFKISLVDDEDDGDGFDNDLTLAALK